MKTKLNFLLVVLFVINMGMAQKKINMPKENKARYGDKDNYEFVPLFMDVLKKNKFVFLNKADFDKKITQLLKIDVKTNKRDDQTLTPCGLFNLDYTNDGDEIPIWVFLDKGFISTFNNIITVDKLKNNLQDSAQVAYFINFNKMILHNDSAAVQYFIKNNPRKLRNLVCMFGFVNNNDSILKAAFEYELNDPSGVQRYNCDFAPNFLLKYKGCYSGSRLRVDVLYKMAEYATDMMNTAIDLLENIDRWGFNKEDKLKATAYILDASILERGNAGYMDGWALDYLKRHVKLLDTFKSVGYFHLKNLAEFCVTFHDRIIKEQYEGPINED